LPSKHPTQRLEDILENIGLIKEYTRDASCDSFIKDRKTQDAVERCLARISEAASKLEGAAEALIPDQRWPEIQAIGISYDTNMIPLTLRSSGTSSAGIWTL
jgi:uncharacterized protein with HEPN domain